MQLIYNRLMKPIVKKIIVNVALLFAFAVLFVFFCIYLKDYIALTQPDIMGAEPYFHKTIVYFLLNLVGAIGVAVSIVLFNLEDIKKLIAKCQSGNEKRAAAKAEKAEADKQAKIAELEAELEELKKDE